MSEQNVREIQLSGKQLVFLFAASAGVAVVIFLLGVSVGRGVEDRTAAPVELVVDASEGTFPVEPLPPTVVTPEQQSVLGAIAGAEVGPPGGGAPPAAAGEGEPALDEPDVADEPVAADPPDPVEPDEPAPAASEPAPAAPAPVERETPAVTSPSDGWSVQTGAYRSRESADREAASLAAQGFAAYVDASSPTGLFRVRVGPFRERAGADEVAARLRQQGLRPLVTR